VWSAGFNPARRDFEAISCVAQGKAARQPMYASKDPTSVVTTRKPSAYDLRRSTSAQADVRNEATKTTRPPVNRIPSMPTPKPNSASILRANTLGVPTEFTTASGFGHRAPLSAGSVSPRVDYFDSTWNQTSQYPGSLSPQVNPVPTALAAPATPQALAARKKPPPPPPPKPKQIGSKRPDEFVVALYAFTGQGHGDLNFQEGDRIKIIKRTQTDQDWWEGELASGAKGSFPANYCRPA
jgi:amphiphysin